MTLATLLSVLLALPVYTALTLAAIFYLGWWLGGKISRWIWP